MFKNISLALVALSLAAGQASALSCVKPDPVAAFNFAAESEKTYLILRGKLGFDPKKLQDPAGPPIATKIATNFKGKLLTADGFTDDIEVPVTLALNCAGPWCARISPNTDYMAFVVQMDQELIFGVSPCYQFAFANPTEEAIERVEQCAAGGPCEPATGQ